MKDESDEVNRPRGEVYQTSPLFQNSNEDDCESDGSLQWEDFFGTSVDLVHTLLDVYDSLVGNKVEDQRLNNNPRYQEQHHQLVGGGGGKKESKQDEHPPPHLSITGDEHHRPRDVNRPSWKSDVAIMSSSRVADDTSTHCNTIGGTRRGGKYDYDYSGGGRMKYEVRPLSCSSTYSFSSSTSSSSSSSSSGFSNTNSPLRTIENNYCKKPHLASIESLSDDIEDVSEDEGRGGSGDGDGGGEMQRQNMQKVTSANRPKYCDPNLSYVDRVVMEIVDSESTYVKDLGEVIKGYLEFMKNNPESIVSQASLQHLFGNIDDIHRFNRGVLEDLEQCGLDPVLVAKTFVKHNEGFAIYTQYCTNYPRTVSVLIDLMRNENTAKLFQERQLTLGHTLPLGSYLLKPVQRITKYHLLLQNIVKHYNTDKDGYDDIVNALSTMRGIALHMNNMKKKHEHAVRVQEIQSWLRGWQGPDLTTYGELLAEGEFRIYGAKSVRHVSLFDRVLLLAKKKDDGILSYKYHIMCSNLMLNESIPGEPLCFHVIPFDNPRIQYTLQARSVEHKREWTLLLKRVMLENHHAEIPYHAKELVMQLGQNMTDDEGITEKYNYAMRQHSAPGYLEKRKHDKERRKSDNSLNLGFRMRKGSKRSDSGSSIIGAQEDNVRCSSRENYTSREASSSRERESGAGRQMSSASLNSHGKRKERKSRSWRRKSNPCDYSSKESLVQSSSSGHYPHCSNCVLENDRTVTHAVTRGCGSCLASSEADPADVNPPGPRSRDECLIQDGHHHPSHEDINSEYVTFYFSERQELNGSDGDPRCNTPIYDVPFTRTADFTSSTPSTPDYDELSTIFSKGSRSDVKHGASWLPSGRKPPIRRVHSFNSSELGSSGEPHLPFCDSGASPTKPSVWLVQQEDHLVEGSLKAGSLPRSFQIGQEPQPPLARTDYAVSEMYSGEGGPKLRRTGDRPFTIASENPSHADLNFEDCEMYHLLNELQSGKPIGRFPAPQSLSGYNDCDDSSSNYCTDTPGESTEDISGSIHPSHRIYSRSISKSALHTMMANVGLKLSSRKTASGSTNDVQYEDLRAHLTLDQKAKMNGLQNGSGSPEREKIQRFLCTVARVYNKVIGSGRRGRSPDGRASPSPSRDGSQKYVPIHRQGSPTIGARMAQPWDQCEYSVPRFNIGGMQRPYSVISTSSNATFASSSSSSSDGGKTSGLGSIETTMATVTLESSNATKVVSAAREDSDGEASGDSFYERSFEAIDGLEENNTLFRDSAVYSDNEDGDAESPRSSKDAPVRFWSANGRSAEGETYVVQEGESVVCEKKMDMVDSSAGKRVRGSSIQEKLKVLEESAKYRKEDAQVVVEGLKSIGQRRRELELWKAGCHGSDVSLACHDSKDTAEKLTVQDPCEACEDEDSEQALRKGWVRNMVVKFQGDQGDNYK